jgi:pyruvate dehydrogenase E2 component (dihydrolipoamide acetyltransferase)
MPDVTMPRLSDTMQEGKIARWLKQPGARVAPGDVLAEIETDKATMELEAYDAGVLQRILVPEGQSAPIGQAIAVIGADAGTAAPPQAPSPEASPPATAESTSDQTAATAQPPAPPPAQPPASAGSAQPAAATQPSPQPTPSSSEGTATPAPSATPPGSGGESPAPAAAEATSPAAPSQPAPNKAPGNARPAAASTAAPADTAQAAPAQPAAARPPADQDEVRASPMARAIARERGIDLRTVHGSGPGGRVIRADVEALGTNGQAATTAAPPGTAAVPPTAAAAPPPASAAAPPAPAPAPTAPTQPAPPAAAAADAEVRPVGRVHLVMADRTLQSIREIPQYYLTSEIDMHAALDLRRQLEAAFGEEPRITINAIVLRAVALALREVPEVNSVWRDGQWTIYRRVHLGVAVAIPDGLIVPVIRDADQKSLREIAVESRALAGRAREGKLALPEVQGSTFSVTNLGMFDVEEFHGIINPPEAGLLAVGTVVEKPVGLDGQIVLRPRMRVTLTADHRAYSGDVGARFLQAAKRLLEQPLRLGF